MKQRLQLILTKEELKRISINDKEKEITVDVHRMHRKEAKRLIKNLICLVREAFKIIIIHGYNSGVTLQQMFRREFNGGRVDEILVFDENPGLTKFNIAAA